MLADLLTVHRANTTVVYTLVNMLLNVYIDGSATLFQLEALLECDDIPVTVMSALGGRLCDGIPVSFDPCSATLFQLGRGCVAGRRAVGGPRDGAVGH